MLPANFFRRRHKTKARSKPRYTAKRYQNPFFKKRTRRKKRSLPVLSWRIKLLIAAVSAVLIGSALFLVYSSYFSIRDIRVSGQGRIDPAMIEELAWQQINDNLLAIFPQHNIFLFNRQKLLKLLNQRYSFNQLSIQKKLPHTLVINYQEKEYAVILCENDEYFYADRTGEVIAAANLIEVTQKDYPIIQNDSDRSVKSGDNRINPDYLSRAIEIFRLMKGFEDLKVDRFLYQGDPGDLELRLVTGPRLIFGAGEDLQKQINKLKIIKNEKLKGDFMKKSYIDVRFGDSVYYR